jgi:hypothetical protein
MHDKQNQTMAWCKKYNFLVIKDCDEFHCSCFFAMDATRSNTDSMVIVLKAALH